MNSNKTILLLVAIIACSSLGYYFYKNHKKTISATQRLVIETPAEPVRKYGFDTSRYVFSQLPIKRNQFVADILMAQNIAYEHILTLEKKAEEVFSLRRLKAGKELTIVTPNDDTIPSAFIYKPDVFSFVKYNLIDSIFIEKGDIPYKVCREEMTGTIEHGSTLSQAIQERGGNIALVDELEDALAQVYFPHARAGDQFKIIYEQKTIEGAPVGQGKILAASYRRDDTEDFGIYFENERYNGYYDFEGAPNKKTFLRAPVKASRISSMFNRNRLHPVLKVRRPHLGTDYAAARGTPIFSVADGTITKRSFTRGNGNYVKIRHDGTYESQYLHMVRFAKGQRVGSRVKQGQVIGYVGKTGLATGYHVCFRFWKNGRQINHLRENFPPLNPMPKESLPEYYTVRDSLLELLDLIKYEVQSDPLALGSIE